jgi:flavin reductase (DIM6/NTAB) family NADH-FMN oxidoreductase RutF
MKIEFGAKNCLYPMPTVLVGALVDGTPNYLTIAHVGIMELESVSLGMNKRHYTNAGIKTTKTFSINIPSKAMIKETDFCGLISGKDHNKADMFKTFYGILKTAPMIEQCCINMECELIKTIDFPNHDVFIGKIINTYCDETILTNDEVDIEKVQPILFVMNNLSYYSVGEKLGKAWNIGKELNK